MPHDVYLSHEDEFYDVYGTVQGLCLPWLGESSGVGLAPWVCQPLNIPTPTNWPYGAGDWVHPPGPSYIGRPPPSPSPREGVRGPRWSLDWFVMEPTGVCPDYPILSSIDRGLVTKVANGDLPDLLEEIGRILPHLVGEDQTRFRLFEILTQLGIRLPETTLWVLEA